MPYTLHWDGQGLVKKLTGFVSADEHVESTDASTSHPKFEEAKYIINDFSDISGHDVDRVAMEFIASIRLGASIKKSNLRVIYVSPNESIRSFVDELTIHPFDGSWETRSFKTMDEAQDWLKRQPEPV